MLLMAARLLPEGRAFGVDLWKRADQSGNAMEATEANADLEGVRDRIELQTGDMSDLPFADANFDVVVSSLAIHNIRGAGDRRKAVDEAARVLKPGGRILIADIQATGEYATRLRDLGFAQVQSRWLDWRFWYGGPWMATKLVSALKPPAAGSVDPPVS